MWFVFLISSPPRAREQLHVLVMRNGDRLTCDIKRRDSDWLASDLVPKVARRCFKVRAASRSSAAGLLG